MIENNNKYGALNNEQESKNVVQTSSSRQRFDIVEPNYNSGSNNSNIRSAATTGCCGRNSDTDGFKIIVISMFVFAVGVTVALIITIASGG